MEERKMSIFHKTLNDVVKAIEDGKNNYALEILTKHLQDEHGAESELMKLVQSIHSFQAKLVTVKGAIKVHMDYEQKDLTGFIPQIKELEKVIRNIEEIVSNLQIKFKKME